MREEEQASTADAWHGHVISSQGVWGGQHTLLMLGLPVQFHCVSGSAPEDQGFRERWGAGGWAAPGWSATLRVAASASSNCSLVEKMQQFLKSQE